MGQNRVMTGMVLDSLTRGPIAGASVSLLGTGRGSLTDGQGKFHIMAGRGNQVLRFSASGYNPLVFHLSDSSFSSSPGPLTILLSVNYTALQQVVVNKRRKYRNKNNPAVELMREVIGHKEQNAPAYYPQVSYDQYDKIRVLSDHPPKVFSDGKLFKRYHFLFNPDTVLVPGKQLVPIYMEETFSRNYSRRSPDRKKQVILGHKRVDLGEYVDMSGVSAIMDKLYQDFSIYDNTMLVFTLQFMGPVAKLGPNLYEYFIRDTTVEEGVGKVVRVEFVPRNSQDLLFKGNLYIVLDGSYAIRKVEMEASNHSNVNWVRSFTITQEYEKGAGGRYYRSYSDMLSYFSLVKKDLGFYGERTVTVPGVADSTLPEHVFRGLPVDTTLQSVPQPDSFWVSNRPEPLSQAEARTYTNMDSLVKMRSYRRLMDWITLFTSGYKSAGKFDIGLVPSFYAYNSLEGSRYQFGGRSNAKLSKRIFTDDYIAYGVRDQRWKYYVSATYSINHKSIYSYPFHFIQAGFTHDVRNPGAENEFVQDNSFLGSFNRGLGGKWLYTDIVNLSYVHELGDHFSYNLGARYWLQVPAGDLHYVYGKPGGGGDTVTRVTTSQLSATLRWAPHEQFYQGRSFRQNVTNRYPIFTLQYALGLKGPLSGQFGYNAFRLGIFKRWYVAPLGYSDITVNMGYITGSLPFPLLIIQPSNTAYYYSFSSYNLMNVSEFITDKYAGVNIDHYFNGFFLNKIPLLKKLRLREVVEGKVLFGGLRAENDPGRNPLQMRFPVNDQGQLTTYGMTGQPYVEAGAGIYNIFNILRVDYIHRWTYKDHPGVPTDGVRLSTSVNF